MFCKPFAAGADSLSSLESCSIGTKPKSSSPMSERERGEIIGERSMLKNDPLNSGQKNGQKKCQKKSQLLGQKVGRDEGVFEKIQRFAILFNKFEGYV